MRYVAKRLPLRRHGNDQGSNFKQLLQYRAEGGPVFSEWLKRKNKNFTSSWIQNKILQEMS